MGIDYQMDLRTNMYWPGEDPIRSEADRSNLGKLLNSEEPLVLEDYEGSRWMRGSCDKRPC